MRKSRLDEAQLQEDNTNACLVCFKMLFYLMIRKELFQIFASSDAVGEGKDVVGLSMSLEVRDICNRTSDVM